jgi:predicted membrane protein
METPDRPEASGISTGPYAGRSTVNPGRLLLGLVLVALGVVFLLDRLGVGRAGELVGQYWPLVIVAAGVLQLVVTPRAYLPASVTVAVGLILLAATTGLLGANVWQVFWPIVLIAVSLLLLAGVLTRSVPRDVNRRDTAQAMAIFSGHRITSQSQQFHSASLTAVFGGVTLDLTQARLAPEGAVVDVMAAFGGVEILVPSGWRVSLSGVPIFGGFSDKTPTSGVAVETAPGLEVRGVVLFGGAEVKHPSGARSDC